MSTNHTKNYNLSQWEETDQVLRTEFNENNAKLDAALTAQASALEAKAAALAAETAKLESQQLRIHTGIYRGTGTDTNVLTFPFPPKIVWIVKTFQYDETMTIFGTTAVHRCCDDDYGTKFPWNRSINQGFVFSISGNTLTIRGSSGRSDADNPMFAMNRSSFDYMYAVIG